MADIQKAVARSAQGKSKAAGTSDGSPKSSLVVHSESAELSSSSKSTPATTQNGSSGTLQKADLITLNVKAGLVAGAYSDFQNTRGGRVTVKQIVYKLPSGRTQAAILSVLSVDGYDLELVALEGFLDFAVVTLGSIKQLAESESTK